MLLGGLNSIYLMWGDAYRNPSVPPHQPIFPATVVDPQMQGEQEPVLLLKQKRHWAPDIL